MYEISLETASALALVGLIVVHGVYSFIVYKYSKNTIDHNYILDMNGIHRKKWLADAGYIVKEVPSANEMINKQLTKTILDKAAIQHQSNQGKHEENLDDIIND